MAHQGARPWACLLKLWQLQLAVFGHHLVYPVFYLHDQLAV
jgi:hypothetical protein